METLFDFLEYIGPVLAAILTVPILQVIKHFVGFIDDSPAWVKQISAVAIAFGLTELGQLVDQTLPLDFSLFTADDIAGLVSAGIAMAIHAGKKASSVATSRSLPIIAALFLLGPVAAACQTGSATVTVVDRSRLVVEVTPQTYTGEVGDTLTFTALAIDTVSGDTIPSIFRWSSADADGVSVDPSSGFATLLQAGVYDVEAMVERIVAMIITRQHDDGSWGEVWTASRQEHYSSTGVVPPMLELDVGEAVNVCAYLVSDDEEYFRPDSVSWRSTDPTVATVTSSTSSQDICPLWDPGLGWVSRAFPTPMPRFMRTAQRG